MFNIPLIDTSELDSLLKSDNVTLILCKDSPSLPTKSIPGSHSANMNITFKELQEYFKKLVFTSHDIVVCYDIGSLEHAARMWWGLRSIGHDKVLILNGGLESWKKSYGIYKGLEHCDLVASYKNIHNLEDFYFIEQDEMSSLSEDVYEVISTNAEEYKLITKDGALIPNAHLVKYLKTKGVSLRDTKLTICTGDYACTLLFGLSCIGRKRIALLVEDDSCVKRRSMSLSAAFDCKSLLKIRNFAETVPAQNSDTYHYSVHQDFRKETNNYSRRSTGEESYRRDDEEKRCAGCSLL